MADELPDSLTLDEAFRAAVYMVELYASLEPNPSEPLNLLLQCLHSDPARWEDWLASVCRGLADGGSQSNLSASETFSARAGLPS